MPVEVIPVGVQTSNQEEQVVLTTTKHGSVDVTLYSRDQLEEIVNLLKKDDRFHLVEFDLSDRDSIRGISQSTEKYAERIKTGHVVFIDTTPVSWYKEEQNNFSVDNGIEILAENIGTYILPPPSRDGSKNKLYTLFILTTSEVLSNNPIWDEINTKRS